MQDHPVVHATFTVRRNYPKPVSRVFAYFADPAQKRRWYAEGEGSELLTFDMDFTPAGAERLIKRMKPGTPIAGETISYDNRFEDIVGNRRIVMCSTMSRQGRRVSASLITFEFTATDSGTELSCTFQGAFFEGADGPQLRETGWKYLLDMLGAEMAG